MTLEELGKALKTYPVEVEVHFASAGTAADFRKRAATILAERDCVLLVNYFRQEMGQEGGGHISPLAAYHDAEGGRVLILDVARYKYQPVWVQSDTLWRGMMAQDEESKKSRGFVVVSTTSKK
jgi:hypothetical protein